MKIMILSANTGGGHNAAANAIKSELEARCVDCKIVDSLSYLSETVSDFISWGHSYVYRKMPKLFGKAYLHEEKHTTPLMYESMSLGVTKFCKDIENDPYDAFISVHVFGAMLVTAAKQKGLNVPCYYVSTDYTCHPGVADLDMNAYFIPSSSLNDEFKAVGIKEDKLIPTGIPVKKAFFEPLKKQEARKLLNFSQTDRIVLLCCGSMGAGNMEKVVKDFSNALPEDVTLAVVCGKNERTYRSLERAELPNVIPIGFTTQFEHFVAAADICVTKPGGITVTELTAAGLPMIMMLAVPGCETRNYNYFTTHGLAVGAQSWQQAIDCTVSCLRDASIIPEMKERLKKENPPYGAGLIADFVLANGKSSCI